MKARALGMWVFLHHDLSDPWRPKIVTRFSAAVYPRQPSPTTLNPHILIAFLSAHGCEHQRVALHLLVCIFGSQQNLWKFHNAMHSLILRNRKLTSQDCHRRPQAQTIAYPSGYAGFCGVEDDFTIPSDSASLKRGEQPSSPPGNPMNIHRIPRPHYASGNYHPVPILQ